MELTESSIAELKVDEVAIMDKIAAELGIKTSQVSAVVSLVSEGCTIPFISRYRKERTGSLDEVQVRDSAHKFETGKALEERRLEVIRGIFALGKLDEALYVNLRKADDARRNRGYLDSLQKEKEDAGACSPSSGDWGHWRISWRAQDEAAVDEAAPLRARRNAGRARTAPCPPRATPCRAPWTS